ncbi:50S ribosomal protein L10 [Phaeodactylibacter sp.]|jgi:large subunit ribosomal protein L10|uniref:50S ribosomal protein L10 n=1 Tax=Phaeodactylibacter sp. TaxID=1940289 RepID=UPI0025D20BBC|nr:50S ribosomal protein L10 [Phaeodactylibacter sp.]MCI4648906.1 50S ribosomal protein L10 [Phaeodactylibacter sp.]MCI5094021.1 50S ribosomal protein L10 [Phaeodactylibacter sp.]
MTRAEKTATIEALKEKLSGVEYFYLADSSTLTVEQINKFRGMCFEKGVEMKVVKNTLIKKALEAASGEKNYEELHQALKGHTAILFTETANAPAKLIKEFRKDSEKPTLKAAYIESDVYIGDDQLEALANLKSKEDLLAEVITLLQSPAKNVIGSLKSGGQTIAGLLKALEERAA